MRDRPTLTDRKTREKASAQENDDVKGGIRIAWILSAIAFLFFTVFVYTYAHFGGPWVDSLDNLLGEIVGERAESLVKAGMTEQAIEEYRLARGAQWETAVNHARVMEDFAELLLTEEHYDEAFEVAQEILEFYDRSGNPYNLSYRALTALNHNQEALKLTGSWLDWAMQNGVPAHKAWAKFYSGKALVQLDRRDEAAEAFGQVYDLNPTGENAVAAAQQLHLLKRYTKALDILDVALNNENDPNRSDLLQLREQIASKAQTSSDAQSN